MKLLKSGLFYLAVILVILTVLTEETEGRRRVLRGRKAITRRYYRGLAIPAWAICVIVGLSMLLVGGGIYLVMRKLVLSDSPSTISATQHSYTPAQHSYEAAPMHDDV